MLVRWVLLAALEFVSAEGIAELEGGTKGKWDGAAACQVRGLRLERERQRQGRIQPRCEQEVAAHVL